MRRLATSALAALLTGLILTGVGIASLRPQGSDAAFTFAAQPTTAPDPAVSPPPPTTTPSESQPGPAASSAADLTAHVPSEFRDTCDEYAPGAALAAVDCTPLDDDAPGTVRYFQFEDGTTMDDAFDAYADTLLARDCPRGQTSWDAGGSGGRVACYTDDIGGNYVVWTDAQLDILGYAETFLVGPAGLHRWWTTQSGPV